jgi:hypothetical protein
MTNLQYITVRQHLNDCYGLTPEELLRFKRSQIARILKTVQVTASGELYGWYQKDGVYHPKWLLEPSSFKNYQNRREESTLKQASNLIRRSQSGGHFTCFTIEMGNRPVSSGTMGMATGMSDRFFGDLPRFEKLEQGLTKNDRTHLQGIVLSSIDWGEELELNGHVVKFLKLGKTKEYEHLPVEEQVKRFIRYLKKPVDSKVLHRNKQRGLKPFALLQWFELAHSQSVGASVKFRSSRSVSLGRRQVMYPEELMQRFFSEEVSMVKRRS